MAECCDLETLIDADATSDSQLITGLGRLAATPERQKHPVMCEQRAGLAVGGQSLDSLQKASADFTNLRLHLVDGPSS